jgi:succinoglycan biosynthesis protein ExoM
MTSPAAQLSVCVAIPTYRRPATLARLLDSIAGLHPVFEQASVDVVVLDNDAALSAKAVARAYAERFPFPLRYEEVPERGLASVRNHALRYARGRYHYLAMIDDDEIAEPRWLAELLRVGGASAADVVIGSVPRRLPPDAPRWIARGRFFHGPTLSDGAVLSDGETSSCLLALDAPALAELEFDRSLDLAGGEDQLFFRQVHQRGGRIVFAAESVAVEDVAQTRLRARYLLGRELRKGNSLWYCDARIHGTPAVLATRIVKGLARCSLGLVLLIPRTLGAGRTGLVASLCDVARGAGMLLGACGVKILGYR